MKKIIALLTPLFFLFMMAGSPAYAGFSGQTSVKPQVTNVAKPVTKAEVKPTKKGLKNALRTLAADNKILAAVISFFIPPLGVLIYENDLTTHFWISLVLTLLFWLPGFIYALWIIFKS